jgi:hypothetical protein
MIVQPVPEITDWKVVYNDSDPIFKTTVIMKGIHMLIINDSNKVFYPILQANMERIQAQVENNQGMTGETDIKMMVSYYNNNLDVWEPLLERTNLKLSLV